MENEILRLVQGRKQGQQAAAKMHVDSTAKEMLTAVTKKQVASEESEYAIMHL